VDGEKKKKRISFTITDHAADDEQGGGNEMR
jgi:hypothetical protein